MAQVQMPDLLTLYASSQPGKLAVIDDRPGGTVVSWTYAQLEAEANRLANALASLGVGTGDKVIWCGPNSPQVVAVVNATRKLGAVAVPLNYRLTAEEARYIVAHSDARAAYVDAEYAHLIPLPQDERLGNLRHVLVHGGAAPPGMLGDDLVAAASAEPPGGGGRGHRRDDDLHLRHDREAEGRLPHGDRSEHGHRADRLHRLHARRHLPHLRAAVSQRPAGVHGRRPPARADDHHPAQVRPAGLAAAGRHVQGQLHVLRPAAGPASVRAARRGQGPLRPVVDADHAGQCRAVELRAQAGLPGRLPGGLALGDLRLDRARGELRARAEGPAAQARLVRQAGPGIEIRLLDADGNEVAGTGPEHSGELYVRSTGVFNEYYKQPDSYAAACTATSTPWATSPTATTRATTTSATARTT